MRRFQRTLLAASLVVPAIAVAQTPRTLTLRIDNDAFDFWMLPWNRPDEEYSSGVHITFDGGDAPWWSRKLLRPLSACTTASRECRMGRAEIGQDLYTPATSAINPTPAPGSRPNAGWLYVSQAARALRESRSDEYTLIVGVTGPQSLGKFTQTLAHSMAPTFNRPVDWSGQVGFEPGVAVRYEQRRRFGFDDRAVGFDLVPRFAMIAGNVSTAAEVGLQTRTGLHLRHPWLPRNGPFEFTLTGGISGRAVARDLFLDGNTFRDSPHVGHETFVGSGEIGVHVHYRALTLAYRAVNDTRSYAAGPKWHPWASMVGAITFGR